MTPINIMLIPHDSTFRTIHLSIPVFGIALIAFFSLVGAIYLCSLIPDVIRTQGMKRQVVSSYSEKVPELNATFIFPANDIRAKTYEEKRTLFKIKAADVSRYDQIISRASGKYNVDADLIKAIIKEESNFDHRAVSPQGAQGLMQLMPQTAQSFQVEDSFHPENNIEAGTRYLRYLLSLFEDDISLAVAAYNAGENAVIKYNNSIPPFRGTQTYVQRVLEHLNSYRQISKRIMQGKSQQL